MAEVKVAEQKETIPAEVKTPLYRVAPRYGVWAEDGKWIIQVALPGVTKEKIHLKTLKDYFQLRAERDRVEYVLDLELDFQIEQEKTKAEYKEGLLRVEITEFNPLDHAVEVKIE